MKAWGPLGGQGVDGIVKSEILAAIGQKYGKTAAQVAIRWLTQRGIVAIPKSSHKERMAQNFDVFDFRLSDADMQQIATLNQYDTIFIGGPVWWGTYPQVMFTFFERYDLNGKTLIPFTTHEGSGLASCVEDVKKAYPNATVRKPFSIYGHEVRSGRAKVEKWLKSL